MIFYDGQIYYMLITIITIICQVVRERKHRNRKYITLFGFKYNFMVRYKNAVNAICIYNINHRSSTSSLNGYGFKSIIYHNI